MAAIVGCDDLAAPGESLNVAQAKVRASTDLDRISYSLAIGLGAAESRQIVLNAMRDSRVTEHKIVLQEVVAQPQFEPVVARAAAALGVTPSSYVTWVKSLPELDWYLPSRYHRRTWSGTPDVVVGATESANDTSVIAFSADGRSEIITAGSFADGRPLMLLHAAEPKYRRSAPQPIGRGSTIESSNDGRRSGQIRLAAPDGSFTEHNLADISLMAVCDSNTDPECEGGVGPGGGTVYPTYLMNFMIAYANDGFGCAEVEYRFRFKSSTGQQIGYAEYRENEVCTNGQYFQVGNMIFTHMSPVGTQSIEAELYEIDPANPDEYWGSTAFFASDSGATLTTEAMCYDVDHTLCYGGMPVLVVTSAVRLMW